MSRRTAQPRLALRQGSSFGKACPDLAEGLKGERYVPNQGVKSRPGQPLRIGADPRQCRGLGEPELLPVAGDVPLMLFEGLGEGVRTVGPRDEVDVVRLLRMQHSFNGGKSRITDRRRGQGRKFVRIEC